MMTKDLSLRGIFIFSAIEAGIITIHTRFSSIHTWVKPAHCVKDMTEMKKIVNCNIADPGYRTGCKK